MRWLIGVAVVAAIAVAGDAALRSYVEGRIEAHLAAEVDSRSRPDVSLGGFPIAVRLLSGRVPTATVEVTGARRAGLEIARLRLDLEGVHISLDPEQSTGSTGARVERGRGVAEIEHGSLGDYIEQRTPLRVIAFDGQKATVSFRGRRATVPLQLEGGTLVLRIPSMDDVTLPLPRLLGGIEYGGIGLGDGSFLLTFELHNATLRSI